MLRGRDGKDISATYPEVTADLAVAAGRRSLILDGEIVAFDGGRPSFSMLQKRMHAGRPALALTTAFPVSYVAFDLLHQAGRSLLRNPYAQRRALLDALGLEAGTVSVPPAFPGEVHAVIIASRPGSPFAGPLPGRTYRYACAMATLASAVYAAKVNDSWK